MGWHIASGQEGDVIFHNGGTGGYRTFAGFVLSSGRGVVVFTNSDQSVDDIGFHLLDPNSNLEIIKPHIAGVFRQWIDANGTVGLMEQYTNLKQNSGDSYDFSENEINSLGYYYLGENKTDVALVLFKINVMEYPASSNVYDSYGEALMKNGQNKEAIENYQKSFELNPGNTNALDMLAKMGVEKSAPVIEVDESVLQTYLGVYEIVPGFNIEIMIDGKQLFGQATGQSKFELFAKSQTEFYLKVVDAQIVFAPNDVGVITMTLYQNGQVMPGKKL